MLSSSGSDRRSLCCIEQQQQQALHSLLLFVAEAAAEEPASVQRALCVRNPWPSFLLLLLRYFFSCVQRLLEPFARGCPLPFFLLLLLLLLLQQLCCKKGGALFVLRPRFLRQSALLLRASSSTPDSSSSSRRRRRLERKRGCWSWRHQGLNRHAHRLLLLRCVLRFVCRCFAAVFCLFSRRLAQENDAAIKSLSLSSQDSSS